MATNIKKIISNLVDFYDFTDKVIVSVGAGGGQLIEYGRNAKKVFAIDNDCDAIKRLEDNLRKTGLADKFEVINSDFYDIKLKCDVVLFEFCLHEMANAQKAIEHAKTLSNDVVVMDHWVGSEWAYYVDEKEKVEASWSALKSFKFKEDKKYDTVQSFNDYEELYQKVKVMGEVSINRIQPFLNLKNFTIPMAYGIVLI